MKSRTYQLWIFLFIAIDVAGWIFVSSSFLGQKFFIPWQIQSVKAADGGGGNTVNPTVTAQSSTGNTFTFTYTSDVAKDSGQMSLMIPSGWSAPQGSNGTAGYTTATSAGIIGTVINNLDSTANWGADNHMALSVDTSDFQEGTGSLVNTITSFASALEQWYFNYGSPVNWGTANGSNGPRIGMWMRSSVSTASGDLSWQDSGSANLASPLDTVAIPSLTANTWTYTSVNLGAARAAISSYGFRYTNDIGAATVKADALSSLFDTADTTSNWSGGTGVTVSSLTTAGNFKEGTGSIRCSYSVLAVLPNTNCISSNLLTATTFGPGTTVSFWIRSSTNTSSTDLQWLDSTSALAVSPQDTVNLPALSANTWTYVTITAPNSANLAALSYGINRVNNLGTMTIDIDAMGKIIDTLNSTSGWTAPTATVHTLATDASIKKEGSGSLKDTITAAANAGESWYENFTSAKDWSGYTMVGLWIRSSVNTNSGNLQFVYSNSANVTSPIAALNIGALTADTWSYQKVTLSGSRNTIMSYGIKYAADIGAATIYLDYVLAGPGSPIFTGSGPWYAHILFLALSAGQTVTINYGAGGGTSGVTASSTIGPHTFTTKDQDASDTTLTSISNSPIITLNAQPVLGTVSATPNPVDVESAITFSSGIWSDANSGDAQKMFVCKTNALSNQSTGGCAGGTWFASSGYSASNPQTGTYAAQAADVATSPNNYYVFICDSAQVSNSCSTSTSGTFSAQKLVTLGTSGSQNSALTIPSSGQNVGGAFTLVRDTGTGTVSQIIVSEKGSVDAHNNLSNVKLFYQQAATCSSSIPGGATAFNGSGASFNASDQVVVSGTMPVGTSQVCLYVQLDVGIGALDGQTMEIEISNPAADITVSSGGVTPSSALAINGTTTLNGVLNVDIVDGSGNSVSSPSVTFGNLGFSFGPQTSNGSLGTASQKIRVLNTRSTLPWTLSIAPTGGGSALWSAGASKYDYNDANGATDGTDADSYGGQLTTDPSTGTLVAVSPCSSISGISEGSTNSYSETVPLVSSITLLTASSSASTNCQWDFSGISLNQMIPAAQISGTYTISFMITAA